MKDFLRSVRFKILVAILTVMAGFMIMAVYSGGTAPMAAQIISFITVPMQRASASITGGVTEFFDRFANADALYEENQRLREEVNELRSQMVDYNTAIHENEMFREILGVMENRSDFRVQNAAVIARDPTDWFYSFTIDKGSLAGVAVLDPVITADGLVGYVTEVGANYSKVTTILNVSVDVGAYNSTTRDIGIVTGTVDLASEGLCQMEYLPRDSEIAAGDLILTSGGSLFPKDLVVGQVETVTLASHGTSLVAIIRPAAHIQNVKNVFIITEFEGQGEE